MFMGIELDIIYYTLMFILDFVYQFHIQIIWCTHLLEPYTTDINAFISLYEK